MDVQLVLAVNLMAISALSLFSALMQRRRDAASFGFVNLLVLAIGAATLYFAPESAGVVVALFFVPFVAAPTIFGALQDRMTRLGRFEKAARYAFLAAVFHPTPAMLLSATLARVAASPDPEERARAIAELAKTAPAPQRRMIEARLLVERGEWTQLLAASAAPETARQMSAYRLRALGELGRVEEMTRAFEDMKNRLPIEQTPFAWLFVLAFGGRSREVERLTATLKLDSEASSYWIAVARRHAGDAELARHAFERLAALPSANPSVLAARRQLARDWPEITPLSSQARATIESVAARIAAESARRTKGWRAAPMTLALLAVNAAMFVLETALGGSENPETLVSLGALWSPLVLEQGQYWRLLSATFLHYGEIHFGLNMLMLALIGRDVEHDVGPWRMLVFYLGGALFSSALVFLLMTGDAVRYTLYVGASGAIFALFGVVGALRWRDWRRHRESHDAFRASALALAMVVQIGADFLLPMSSLSAHLSGFVFGLFLGALVTPKRATPASA